MTNTIRILVRSTFVLLAIASLLPNLVAQQRGANDIKVMAWNIWHGGREDGTVVATGFSCRQQIAHFTGVQALSPAALLEQIFRS